MNVEPGVNLYVEGLNPKGSKAIIHDIHDKVIPFSQAKEMNQLITNSQLMPFKYSGHGAFWEEREKFNRLLAQFIHLEY